MTARETPPVASWLAVLLKKSGLPYPIFNNPGHARHRAYVDVT